MTKSICVYCASSRKVAPEFFEAAVQLGQEIGRRGFRLVFGGTDVGLMHAVAEAARQNGASVIGVIPCYMQENGFVPTGFDEVVVTECIRDRKRQMERLADAFVALPGGFGTLDESIEIITQKILGQHRKPLVFVNTNGHYDPLFALFDGFVTSGFASERYKELYDAAPDGPSALDLIEGRLAENAEVIGISPELNAKSA